MIIYRRAKRLYEQVKFPGSSDFKCTPYKPRMVAYVESEDEDVTVDEVQPEFNDVQKGIVNDHFQHLHRMYGATMDHGLYNCIGKDFLRISAMYIKHCFIDTNKLMNIWCLSSTAKGKFQPGALFLNWSLPKRPLRANDENLRYTIPHEKYADNVVYDSEKKVNIVVCEVKVDADAPVEPQHIEQMVGLWKGNQRAMLGLQLGGKIVVPKVVLLENTSLNLYYLPELDLSNSAAFSELLNLMLAFLIMTDYTS